LLKYEHWPEPQHDAASAPIPIKLFNVKKKMVLTQANLYLPHANEKKKYFHHLR
jgi:hypothetical protein